MQERQRQPLTAEDALHAAVHHEIAGVGRRLRKPLADVLQGVLVDTCTGRRGDHVIKLGLVYYKREDQKPVCSSIFGEANLVQCLN